MTDWLCLSRFCFFSFLPQLFFLSFFLSFSASASSLAFSAFHPPSSERRRNEGRPRSRGIESETRGQKDRERPPPPPPELSWAEQSTKRTEKKQRQKGSSGEERARPASEVGLPPPHVFTTATTRYYFIYVQCFTCTEYYSRCRLINDAFNNSERFSDIGWKWTHQIVLPRSYRIFINRYRLCICRTEDSAYKPMALTSGGSFVIKWALGLDPCGYYV